MSAMHDGRYEVVLNGRKYHLMFNLNALERMQDRFGGYDKLGEVFAKDNPNMIKDLKWLLTLLINEGADDGESELTEQQIGKMIHIGNIKTIQVAIYEAFSKAVSGDNNDNTANDNIEGHETEDEGESKAVQVD
jgi:hypothetical protein